MAAIKRRPWLVTAGIALLSAIVTSLVLSPLVRADDKSTVRQLTLFANAFDRITENYVDEVDEKALVEAAIQGMLQSLDPHSGFFTVDAFEDVTEELQEHLAALVFKFQWRKVPCSSLHRLMAHRAPKQA